jgi:hypothetical protein
MCRATFDLNPLEQLFAKLKSFLRKAKARTVERLWKAIVLFLKTVSKGECKAYLATRATLNLIGICSSVPASSPDRGSRFWKTRYLRIRARSRIRHGQIGGARIGGRGNALAQTNSRRESERDRQ